MHPKNHPRAARRASLLLFSGVALTPSSGHAQTPVNAAKAASATTEIVLPPFEVRTDKDEGYLAQNTASGSRLNTSLKDTPAPISVYTDLFLQDIAATDILSMAGYVVNTERLFLPGNNFTDYDPQVRIRGLPARHNSGRSMDFFKFPVDLDTFNTERVEFARGPNSILFGLGSPAGNFNVSAKRADLRRALYEVSIRADSNDGMRSTIDVSQPLIENRLALRLNGLRDRRNSWRPHEHKDSDKFAGAVRYRINRRTTFDFTLEKGRSDQTDHRLWVGADFITDWIAKGRQLDPVARAPYPNAADTSIAVITGPYWVYTTNNGTFANWQNLTQSAATSHFGTQNPPATQQQFLMDFSLVPKETVIGGPSARSNVDYYHYSAFLSSELAKDLFVELAFNRQDLAFLTRDLFVADFDLQADTNAQLPSGAPNPNAGRAYVEATWAQRARYEDAKTYRFTSSYGVDFEKRKLGRHRFGVLFEHRDEAIFRFAASERIAGTPTNPAPVPSNPEAAPNQIRRRTYVDLNGPVAGIALADFGGQTLVPSATSFGTTFEILPQNVIYDWQFRFRTYQGNVQSHFLNDRLVTTFGYREDQSTSHYSNPVRDSTPRTDLGYTVGFFRAVRDPNAVKLKGITRSQGALFHLTKNASVFYNRSSNFSLPNPQITIFPGSPAPSTRGESDDFGFKFSLLGGRAYATILRYETSALQDADTGGTAGVAQINAIWSTLYTSPVLGANPTERDNLLVRAMGNYFDSKSEGYEAELIANPLPNWRLSLNYAYNESRRTNYGRAYIDYIAANEALWTAGTRGRLVLNTTTGQLAGNAIDPADGLTTIAETIVDLKAQGDDTILKPEGARQLGIPTHSLNLRTNYTFNDGSLKGVFIGGGGRWRGSYVIGYTSSDPAQRQLITGGDHLDIDANLGYRRKFRLSGRALEWTIQLNVTNALNDDDIVVTESFSDGAPRQYRLVPPREFVLTNIFRF